jgi:peptide chain release factor 2
MAAPDFWSNQEKAQQTIGAANALKAWLEPAAALEAKLDDAAVLVELAEEEAKDASAEAELEKERAERRRQRHRQH